MARRPKERRYKAEIFKRGKRKFGEVREYPDGLKVYWAYKSMKDIFRNGHKTYSDALRAEQAYWPFDVEVLLRMKRFDVKYLGVLVKENGDAYLMPMSRATDPTTTRLVNRGYVALRHVPLANFTFKMASVCL